jgi:cellulose synthase/poly-beta-1,6-N-acetylglucosamine synthase-like glycosyltransferase
LNHQNNTQDSIPKVIVIFPAKNEEDTIEHSIAAAKQRYYKPDVILVVVTGLGKPFKRRR